MSDQSELWAAVVVSYAKQPLRELTNIYDRGATDITTSVGEDAALGAIRLFPIYSQIAYDAADNLHVEIGKRATIAMLWERGGSASTIARQEWDEVFTSGVIERLKNTGPRGRKGPSTNSNLTQATGLTSSGMRLQPWGDVESLPVNFMPSNRTARR